VQGTGRDGRILKEDMLRHIESLRSSKSAPAKQQAPQEQPNKAAVSTPQQPSPPTKSPQIVRPASPVGVDRTESIKGFKRAMAKSMTAALVFYFG
jgi:pyruvate/2-oxoglutarate dehydrogenase complex dihydrolipoamide acyltransferase (E2) component